LTLEVIGNFYQPYGLVLVLLLVSQFLPLDFKFRPAHVSCELQLLIAVIATRVETVLLPQEHIAFGLFHS